MSRIYLQIFPAPRKPDLERPEFVTCERSEAATMTGVIRVVTEAKRVKRVPANATYENWTLQDAYNFVKEVDA